MTRTLKVLIGVIVLLMLVFVIAGNTSASIDPQIVQVTLKDYQIAVSQFTVAPGKPITLVVNNAGEMLHKLIVQPYAGTSMANIFESPVIGPHTSQSMRFTLAPGVYRIECAQVNHANLGMVSVMVAQTAPQKNIPWQWEFVIPMLGLVFGSMYIIADTLGLRLIAR